MTISSLDSSGYLYAKAVALIFTLVFIGFINVSPGYAQKAFPGDPAQAEFITSDIPRFWQAFDKIEEKKNPFINYLENGSTGLKDFIPNRIESPEKLRKVVKRRYPDYSGIRESSNLVNNYIGQMKLAYIELKKLYSDAVFPPVYFVIGAFNTGGTASDNGLIIGVEKQNNIEGIPYIVAHELIHFNQNYPRGTTTLLEQSIREGSADFIGEIIAGKHSNEETFAYGDANEDELRNEFIGIMHSTTYKGWLYGSKGKKKGRPNDLGYWLGYQICEAYYANSANKKSAINEILNIKDFNDFLEKSGYLKFPE